LESEGKGGKLKSGGALLSPDKHKSLSVRRRFLAFLLRVPYDLEGLGAAAGLRRVTIYDTNDR
jgi:hypothetical protein